MKKTNTKQSETISESAHATSVKSNSRQSEIEIDTSQFSMEQQKEILEMVLSKWPVSYICTNIAIVLRDHFYVKWDPGFSSYNLVAKYFPHLAAAIYKQGERLHKGYVPGEAWCVAKLKNDVVVLYDKKAWLRRFINKYYK